MTAVENSDGTIGLLFTKVLDLETLGDEDDDAPAEPTDRAYWEKRASKSTLHGTDEIFQFIKEIAPQAELTYNKFYLGIWIGGRANNFVQMIPRKTFFYVDIKLPRTDATDELIENSEFEEVRYPGKYQLRVDSKTSEEGKALIKQLIQLAAKEAI